MTTPRRMRAMTFTLVAALGASPALAARDRTKPTKPTNFRVTAVTSFSVSLAWNPSSDNSGNFTYILWSTAGPAVTLPKTATSYTWTGLAPRNYYTFGIFAKDAAGNTSAQSTLMATTPPDTTPPSQAPVVSATDIGANYVAISWTPAVDDGPFLFYQVLVDGNPVLDAGTDQSATVHFLEPDTTYTIQVRGRDYGNNWSPLSEPLVVTTDPVNPDDVTPPTVPGNLYEMNFCEEVHLFWDQSTDDFDPQHVLRYDIYVNGVLQDIQFGTGGPSIVYGNPGELNIFEVVASDTAGNESEPAVLEVNLCM